MEQETTLRETSARILEYTMSLLRDLDVIL